MRNKGKHLNTNKSNRYEIDVTNNLLVPMNETDPISSPIATTTITTLNETTNVEINNNNRKCRPILSSILNCKLFHMIIVILCALDGLLVICMLLLEIESLKLPPSILRYRLNLTSFIFECASYAIITLFLIEIPIKLWTFGFIFYRKQWIELLDAFVCIISFAVDTYNIQRHVIHSKFNEYSSTSSSTSSSSSSYYNQYNITVDYYFNETSNSNVNKSVQTTIADAAGLLVLFRLWRIIRIVNAIIMSVTASQEGVMNSLKEAQTVSFKRIDELEQLLQENNIPIPPLTPKSQSILLTKKLEKT
ncbi:hypothetical protein MN116_000546 [Schistosoma mekongi]|uniref:Voltage-gated hydrogen channel 1 n=1 Tax=Schistosoma mekongi TaxID=38744 RepID=A0AAE1ZD21_SCHME|nr:hypothetical protein MN116_000546 [Schistosoma mekongi]